ncbi:MAG: prolipoprotein diacylglyceryl transferase [Candidatus Moraniibacteriota bacterium]
MLSFWQQFPFHLDPVLFRAGFFALSWYALCALLGTVAAVIVLKRCTVLPQTLGKKNFEDLLLFLFFGTLLGARLGYVFFYNWPLYRADPASILLPFAMGEYIGIAGFSFYGGVLGAALALFFFARSRNQPFLLLTDAAVLAAPCISFFGRIGNFLNQELYGRTTTAVLGMRFPGESTLRHPSTLYEALGEGLLLFTALWYLRHRVRFQGEFTALFLIGYGSIRFFLEYFRTPDPQIGFLSFFGWPLTLGQVFSLGFLVLGVLLFWWARKRQYAILSGNFR